ncbi:MAG: DUF4271 domain-containing protein [Bacteroidales bacterium]|jgi:hypothetical protein|nr:DUF4271 domain-containing protein [Bacteroidales bacterium]
MNHLEIIRDYDFNEIIIIFSISCIILILLLFLNIENKKYYTTKINELWIFNTNTGNRASIFSLNETLSLSISSLSLSLVFFEIINYSNILDISDKFTSFELIIIILSIIILFYSIKKIIIILLGFIFNKTNEVSIYQKFNTILIEFIGILLFPFVAIIPFINKTVNNNIFFYFIVFLLFIIIIFILFKTLFFFYKTVQNKFFNYRIFLYFCAIEIIPYLIIVKFIK